MSDRTIRTAGTDDRYNPLLRVSGLRHRRRGTRGMTWFADPWGVIFILVEKSKDERPYYAQWG
jgi:hypothetical protein